MGDQPMHVFIFGCMSCGKTVDGREKSCPRCGASFEGVKFECPFCGELVLVTQRKCDTCGTEFSAFAEEVSNTSLVELDGSEIKLTDEDIRLEREPASEVVEYECPSCGKPVSEDDVECPHCGARFS